MPERLFDLSIPVSPATPEWPGDTPFSCGWTWTIAAGASVNVSTVAGSPHVGTHADAPLHVRDGGASSDALPLEAFHGPATLLDVSDLDVAIDRHALQARLAGGAPERILLRTGRGIASDRFPAAWAALTPDAARWLTAGGTRLVGVDAPSVDERDSRTLAVHHALFDGGACVLENLDLRAAPTGRHLLLALPQRLVGLDAAPVRAALIVRT